MNLHDACSSDGSEDATKHLSSILEKGLSRTSKAVKAENQLSVRQSAWLDSTAEITPQPEEPQGPSPPPQPPTEEMLVVTPFLAKHIADHNNIPSDNFHKYCYRHNPEIMCNKQADAVKMKAIQHELEKLPSRDQEAISHVWSIFSAAPHSHRSLILRGLLTQCCFPQLSTISQEISQLIRIDFIATLPVEISLKILCYLDCKSLCNASAW